MENIIKRCIYCNKSVQDGVKINESHIIPDTLTNYKKMVYKNVCSIDHNKNFGDTFESDIIEKCRKIRHYLNIKNKNSKIVKYTTELDINGYKFRGKISNFDDLFDGRNLPVYKGNSKFLFKIIKKDDTQSKKILEVFESLKITEKSETRKREMEDLLKMLYSRNMFRLVIKIGYEWFCKVNNINGVEDCYADIINFIINEESKFEIVSIVESKDLLIRLNDELGYGGHALGIYNTSIDKNAYVFFSFFGLALYKIKIRKYLIYIAKMSINLGYDSIDFHCIRYDGSILEKPMKTYTVDYDKVLSSLKPSIAIGRLKNFILETYDNLLYEQIITVKAYKPYIVSINKTIEIYKSNSIELHKKLIEQMHSNVLVVIYIIFIIGQKKSEYSFEKSFQSNIRNIFGDIEKLIVSKNVAIELHNFDSEDFVKYLLIGLSIFKKEIEKSSHIRSN